MVTTDLGACEWFVWDLRRSNLIDRGQLDQLIGEFLEKHPNAEPPALAEYLVAKNILTQFQANRLLEGKTQGFVLGPYTLMDALGTGSMGTVYKAQSKTDGQWYAVKVLPRRSMWNVRIARRKVRAFESCKHPTVVPFLDVGTAGGMHYLSWPLVEGETLEKLVQREGALEPSRAALYARQAAEGLDACHQQGLFHGLFKPSNIMIEPNHQLHILDFGIGALLAETEGESLVDTMSTANSVASGLDCASPESIMDPTNLTPIGDQYSLGCTLYFCLSGSYPFPDGTAAEKMMAHQFKQPRPLAELAPQVPAELLAVVEQLMQKDPTARYGSTGEVIEALTPFAGHQPSSSQGSGKADHARAYAAAKAAALAQHAEPKSTPRPRVDAPTPRPAAAAPAAPVRPAQRTAPPTAKPAPKPAARPAPRPAAAPAPVSEANPDKNGEKTPQAPEPKLKRPPSWTGGREFLDETPSRNWEEKLGPIGIAISAIVMCVLAWLLTWKLF
ncbi:MAG TPA: serine/threonine-protein kinase [Gemmataceae bacterium]|jgi:serine/threonine-protein kinase|nr:serine/threonine-protein kinase [Gemmataceae bacterium]